MKSNIGQTEQIVRGVLGAALILIAGLGVTDGAWHALAVFFGGFGVFTASAGFCPLYRVAGRSTLRR